MSRRYQLWGLLLGFALLVGAARTRTHAAPEGADAIPHIAFEKYTLPNGLDVILSADHRLPRVAVNLWYHVGPANEEAGRTGFAHLFEHLMFQGSKHVPPDSHFRLLEGAGATSINGTTDFDRTNYFETVPSNELALALWIESDRMGYLLDQVDVAQLANQQDVVRNERRQTTENRPYGIAEEALTQTLYPKGHPYYANVIGSHQDIQAVKLDDVKRFFKQYYVPNNASLAIVGDIDLTSTKALVQKYFAALKRGAPVPPIRIDLPTITQERRRVVQDRVELPRVYLGWLTSPIFKPGDAEAGIAAAILADGRASRLYNKLVYEQQIAQSVNAYQQSLILGSMFVIEVTARPGHTAQELEQAIDAEVAALQTTLVTPQEIERARNKFETETVRSLESLRGVADMLNSYNHYLGTPGYLEKDVQRYRAVTPHSVQTFVRDQLQSRARAVIYTVPGTAQLGAPVPTPAPPPSRPGEGAESVNADEPWRRQQPPPGPESPLRLPPPATAQLSNGLTLILSERKGLPIVSASLVVGTGGDANPLDRPGLASFAAAMLDEGTSTRSAMQIATDAAQLGALLTTSSSMDSTAVTTTALKKNFRAALAIVADVVLHPSFPAEEIERQRASRLGALVQQRENALQLAQRTTADVLYGARHPYGYADIGTEVSVKALARPELVAFWQAHYVPNNAALIAAGDITMGELRAAAEKTFGAWPRGSSARTAVAAPPAVTARIVIVNKSGAPQTQLHVSTIGAPRSTPDYPVLRVLNDVLGGLFSSRINMNLREEHGYTYGARSQFTFRRGAGPFTISSGVRTDATAPALGEILNEIKKIRETPISNDELTLAKNSLTRSLPANFETNDGTVGNYSTVYVYGLGLDYFAKYATQVGTVTAQQALEAARRYIAPDRLVVVAVGDASQIEPGLKNLNFGPIEERASDGRGH
jgi:zinc protease